MRAFLADDLLADDDAGAIDEALQPTVARDPAATAAFALVSSATSVRTKRALAPSSVASSLPCLSLKSAMTTLPPASTSMRAVAAPNPDAPPVTMNVLPSICMSRLLP